MSETNEFRLKNSLLLGVTSSATQSDGGLVRHSWTDWYRRGKIKDGASPAKAAAHWDNWRSDILAMHSLGVQTCRFSIEWARVEPEEGHFDQSAIDHIKEEVLLLIGLGIKPLVTLHHYSTPLWFEEKGGWEKYENIRCYLLYVEHIIRQFGHLVSEYITINEPNSFAVNGYLYGIWPPGKKSMNTTMNVMSNLAAAHIKAYRLIHDMRRSIGFRDTKVGVALQFRVFEPKSRLNPANVTATRLAQSYYQELPAIAMLTGEFKKPLKNVGRDRFGAYCDFHAVNYYTRSTISGINDGVKNGCQKNDLGWEIYPQGLVECCKWLYSVRPLPIYITANGVSDLNDGFRARFIYDHLKAMSESKLPFKRYYYRSLTDGFEWLDGYFPRYGLLHTNFDTMERSPKQSAAFYSELIKSRGVTGEMYQKYISGHEYHY